VQNADEKIEHDALTDEVGATPVASNTDKPRKTHSMLKRELSQEDLSQPGVQKMLLGELDKLEEEKSELTPYRDKYYETKLQLGITQEKLKTSDAADIVYGAMMTMGALILGYTPSAWDPNKPTGYLCLGVGIVIVIIGIVAKVKMK